MNGDNNILKKPIFRVFVGFVIILIIIAIDLATKIFSGGLWSTFIISIICTMGFSLIFWLPLTYLIGTVICKLIIFIFSQGDKSDPVDSYKVLEKYILDSKQHGMSKEDVCKHLIDAGWQESQFNNLLKNIYQ